MQSTCPFDHASPRTERSSTNLNKFKPHHFGVLLSPVNLPRNLTRPVSYYALFKWMAASKPTSWLSAKNHIVFHLAILWDLNGWSGLFPFRLRNLSPIVWLPRFLYGIRSLIKLGSLVWPRTHSVALPPYIFFLEASPKAISRRTSYLRARLEFLRYPQVIRWFCSIIRFGPPQDFTPVSPCSWIGRPVSGLPHKTYSLFSNSLSLTAPHLKCLTLPYTVTRWTVMQKVRYRTFNVLYLLVNIGFQILFHSPPGVLFTFPSRYFSLSVTK